MADFRFNRSRWIPWFLGMADYIATASKDPSTQIGAIAINQKKQIVSHGYNGFPRNSDDNVDDYLNREIKYKKVLHAEENIILNCENLSRLEDSVVFLTHPPCMNCLSRLSQVGVATIVCYHPSEQFQSRWNLEESFEYADELGIDLLLTDNDGEIINETN